LRRGRSLGTSVAREGAWRRVETRPIAHVGHKDACRTLRVRAASVTEPPRILQNFVRRYAR